MGKAEEEQEEEEVVVRRRKLHHGEGEGGGIDCSSGVQPHQPQSPIRTVPRHGGTAWRSPGKRRLRPPSEPPVKLASSGGRSGEVQEGVSGEPLVLEVQVSRPGAAVRWLLDGLEIQQGARVAIAEDGLTRRLTLLSPAPGDSGKYTCDAGDDVMEFPVNVTGETEREVRAAAMDDIIISYHN